MEETSALSPEIIGLFMRVQSQAEEFGKAFDMIEKSRKEFEASVAKINELEQNVRNDSEIAISKINTNVLESLIILKNRTEETVKLTIDLRDIKQFKESLEKLKDDLTLMNSKLEKLGDEMESSLRYFKKKSEMELDSTLLSLKSKIDKELQSEGQKIELRINLRVKQLEGILLSFDERIKSIEENASNAFKKLSLEVDLIKHGYNFDNEYSSFTGSTSTEDMSGRITSLEILLNGLSERFEDSFRPSVPPPKNVSDERIEEFEGKIASLNSKIKDLASKKSSDSKSGTATAVAAIAILLSIVAIVLSLI